MSLRNPLFAFPIAALLNSFSMTALLLAYGLTGAVELAAEIGIIQGATLALFYAFSANARNLILADAIEHFSVHPEERKRMGEAAYRLALQNFDIAKTAKQMLCIYERLMHQGGN